MSLPKALFHYDLFWREQLFAPEDREALRRHLDISDHVCGRDELMKLPAARLAELEVLVAGWDATPLSRGLLERMPRLRAVFYAAGDTRGLVVGGECFERGIVVSGANRELARSVAEHTLGFIILSLKNVWRQSSSVRHERTFRRQPGPGMHGGVIGLVAYGAIAHALRGLLRAFKVRVLVYDPYISAEEAEREGVELVGLTELFARADVISCHLPQTSETRDMIGAEHFRIMKPGATFINTARGGVIREDEMMAVLTERPELWAILDVFAEEPPPASHPVYRLQNVIATPHVAGCLGPELARLGSFIVAEVSRWRAGQPLLGEVKPAKALAMAVAV